LKVEGVAVDRENQPVVVLRDLSGKHELPIWIGPAEAVAISVELEGRKPPRPMTHDLIRNILAELQVGLAQVVITDLREKTYYARLILRTNGHERAIDCRPSDAIALALRAGAPIFISEHLLATIETENRQQEASPFTPDVDTGTVH
jgi:bifunctional DNase/RNase